MLLASVPDPVKITSLGSEPIASAITSRASSTLFRAERPSVCNEDGLPTCARAAVIAVIARGFMGVVAA